MAKHDYVAIKSEIGGKLDETKVIVKAAGGSLEVKRERTGEVIVTVLNRNEKPTGERYTFLPGAVRSIEEHLSEQ